MIATCIPAKALRCSRIELEGSGRVRRGQQLAEAGVGTTKQIDVVCKKTFKMSIGSFTAMNLTGGNPITAVGLDNYTSKINSWYRTPQSLKDKVAAKANWDVPARGEVVDVPEALAAQIRDELLGAYFGICGEIVDAGLVTIADFNLGLDTALDMKPAFTFMNELGTAKALALGVHPVICVVMGALTATFGGIIRDVLAGEPSILLRRELYITPAIVSASVFIVLRIIGTDWTWASAIAVALGFIVRAGAIAWKWHMPAFRPPDRKP